MKGSALSELGFNPNLAMVLGDDFAACRQANTGAFILVRGMQPPEGCKNGLVMLRRNANAIVDDGDVPKIVLRPGLHTDYGGLFATELQCIANEILEQLHERGVIA